MISINHNFINKTDHIRKVKLQNAGRLKTGLVSLVCALLKVLLCSVTGGTHTGRAIDELSASSRKHCLFGGNCLSIGL